MDEFTSLSTGCFVVKPSKRRERSLELPRMFAEESKLSSSKRYDHYSCTKKKFEDAFNGILDGVNKDIASEIVSFIEKGLKVSHNIGIPTLTLKIGVNFEEFAPIYEIASQIVHERLSMQCATINSYQNSEITTLLKDVFNQILTSDDDANKVLIKTLSMKGLFNHVIESQNGNGIVLFIPRFDVLQSSIMDKLIEICSSRVDGFPLFFVLGLSTGTELSAEWMSSSAISQLNIETVTPPTPASLLERVLLNSLLSTENPFKLSYRTFEILLSRFSFSSYSLRDVMKTIEVALLTHSMQQPLMMHLSTSSGDWKFDTDDLNNEEKALILQLPSVQKYVEKNVVSNKKLALDLLQGNNFAIDQMFQECKENYLVLFHSFMVLHSLIKNIPGSSLVSKPLELYSFFLQGCVNEVKEVCVALKCFGMLQSAAFVERLKSTYQECQNMENPSTKIQLLMRVLKQQIEEMDTIMCGNLSDRSNNTETKETMEKLKTLQLSFVSRLENYLSTLTAPTTWPLHEIMWYSNHIELQNMLVGKCRTALHRGLTNPNLYLQCSENTPKPDLCHLYEMFHEHGRLISLHDWIQSFNSLLGKKKISGETHAQFISAVSELHFMGYLKPTKRKTDHVSKLSLLGY